MKFALPLALLISCPLISHAFIASCNKPYVLVPALQVRSAPDCETGLGVVDFGRTRCLYSQNDEITKPGLYRACVARLENGFLVDAANDFGAE